MGAAEQIQCDGRLLAWVQSVQTGDPLLFATGVLGFLMPGVPNPNRDPQLEPWQVKALKKYRKAWRNRFDKPGRISIRSGHGVGKTCWLCIIILFTLFAAGPDCKIPVVANSQDQLRDGLWPELNKWIGHLPEEMRAEIKWEAEKVSIRCASEECFAVRRTATKHRPEALQGIHATTVLAIFEEASGIPEETIEAGAGTLSTPGALAVAVGNPTRARGFFHKTHCDPRVCLSWDTMTVSSEDVPRAIGHITDIINLYGKDSNKYRVRVLGEFPTKDDDVVIPLESILAAKGRKVTLSHVYPVWGVDVARFGDDRSTLCKRQGNALIDAPKIWRNLDGKQVADLIVKEYQRTVFDLRPKAICVDAIGIGVSVVDHLRYNPTLTADAVQIISVNVSETASKDPENHRLRDELWWAGREWFLGLDVVIPDTADPNMSKEDREAIEGLIAELAIPTYDFTRADKRIVMTKDDMKRELGYSPDIADGFINTFAAPVFPRPTDTHRRRPWERDTASDPWAA